MSNITKKQATLAVIAVVFAAAMIISVIASSLTQAFAKGSSLTNSLKTNSKQHNSCKTAGGNSAITTSCTNSDTPTQTTILAAMHK